MTNRFVAVPDRSGGIGAAIRAGVLAVSLVAVDAPAVDALPPTVSAELARLTAASENPGLVIAVARDGELVHEAGFGLRDVETQRAASPNMAFRNGSTTKMMVAAALLEALADHEIDTSLPLGTYIDGLDPAIGRLTVHQLLTHTSGLSDRADDFGVHDDDALAENVRSKGIEDFFTEPGAVFSYSNPGYDVAGYVIGRLAGTHFTDAFRSTVLDPAGMTRSLFRPTQAMTYPFALPHAVDDRGQVVVIRPMPDNAAEWPSGLMYTTVGDLARFAIVLMQNGIAADGTRVLRSSTVRALTTGRVGVPGDPHQARYGYGLDILEIDGETVWMHGGAIAGFRANVVMLPEKRLAVTLMTNGNDWGVVEQSTDALLSALAGLRLRVDEPALTDLDAATAKALAGDYGQSEVELRFENRDAGLVTVSEEGEELGRVRRVDDGRLAIIREGRDPAFLYVTWSPDGGPRYLHRGGRALRPMSRGRP